MFRHRLTDAGWGWLVLIGVVNSVISAFYYLGITAQMYFRPTEETSGKPKKGKPAAVPAPIDKTPHAGPGNKHRRNFTGAHHRCGGHAPDRRMANPLGDLDHSGRASGFRQIDNQ